MFRGTGTALVTPFKDGAIDYPCWEKLIERQIEGGVEALIVLGTTGQAATLSRPERDEAVRFALSRVSGRVPVIIGTGTNCTASTIELSQSALELGADGILVVTPFYNKPTQDGLFEHFAAVARAARGKIILYNVPGRTGCNMSPATVLRLATIENIVGVKEASGNQFACDDLIRRLRVVRPDFKVFSGNDDQAFHLVCSGGDGVISVLSNLMPRETSDMIRAALAGRLEEARDMHLKLLPLMKDLFVESNPIPVTYTLARLGLCKNELRLPLVPAAKASEMLLDADLAEQDLLS
ncbi:MULTISPECIES: 4-hydroxy-tetrahydrodipicolinate synthase [Jonquetella]|uniref:4-hydroxy-tetrahydrodipicolinate synthase n=1 Tax=Jonquetella anthropi DSM 22815 TaxID=885272 RepID=H0ULW6_9BACT|nr:MULTISPECIES: 4-hydroxy-tetrahydrodipicolinate synthase [Jonquetella]EEX49250.1 dihydrodipicolinate synthase [Jonquetella anthropi E3_33 E1]EHM12508.1 dihydrodipicolinate synthase [Jonquetella anthropi DSM 22815]ERL24836.1 4-hydroxy-tetrahydrodipicolinate synthase [Jonquetella sp. BV3C21]